MCVQRSLYTIKDHNKSASYMGHCCVKRALSVSMVKRSRLTQQGVFSVSHRDQPNDNWRPALLHCLLVLILLLCHYKFFWSWVLRGGNFFRSQAFNWVSMREQRTAIRTDKEWIIIVIRAVATMADPWQLELAPMPIPCNAGATLILS